jgi:hypothetical protein
MPFKRPSSNTQDSTKSRSSSAAPAPKRARSHPPSHNQASSSSRTIRVIKIYIVQTKLDPEIISDLFHIADGDQVFADSLDAGHHDGVRFRLCRDVGEADIIVTAVHMRRRLERHVDWDIVVRSSFLGYNITVDVPMYFSTTQKEKAIVTPQWLLDSVQHGKPPPYVDYVALHDFHHATVDNYPDRRGSGSDSQSPSRIPQNSSEATPAKSSTDIEHPDSDSLAEYDTSNLKLPHTARYSCCRASPLVCPNQGLVRELDVIRRSRSLEGEERSALSYQRAIAVRTLRHLY